MSGVFFNTTPHPNLISCGLLLNDMTLSFPIHLISSPVTEMLVNVLSICSDDELMNDEDEIFDGEMFCK